jgi:dTDP-glucose 4,6-dehydratase
VEDHAEALQRVFEDGRPGRSYNVGGNAERTNIDVVNALCSILDKVHPREDGNSYAEQITFVADRPGHDARYAIDASRIRDELGWTPRESFESGLEKTVRWYLANSNWWQPLVDERNASARRGLAA